MKVAPLRLQSGDGARESSCDYLDFLWQGKNPYSALVTRTLGDMYPSLQGGYFARNAGLGFCKNP